MQDSNGILYDDDLLTAREALFLIFGQNTFTLPSRKVRSLSIFPVAVCGYRLLFLRKDVEDTIAHRKEDKEKMTAKEFAKLYGLKHVTVDRALTAAGHPGGVKIYNIMRYDKDSVEVNAICKAAREREDERAEKKRTK